MPPTKLAFFRYLLIDEMLRSRSRPFPTKEEILEACNEKFGVNSISTIEKDMAAMRLDFDAPIYYDKRQKGYAYQDPEYKFLSVNLSEDEMLALSFVETLLGEFRNMPIFSLFSVAVDKVLDGLELTKKLHTEKRHLQQAIQIEQAPYLKGSDKLGDLLRYIAEQKVIEVSYQKYGSESTKDYLVHPYLLKEFRNMWYLIGYHEASGEVRTFGIDRITQVLPQEKDFLPQEKVNFDAESFYFYCIGVTALSEKPAEIRLRFEPFLANYVKAQPLHHTQEIIEDDEQKGCLLRLRLIINHELKMLILGYGAGVCVEAPASLAAEIRREFEKGVAQYATKN
ncbi:helix-turn-helix transcriptional regulator [Hugenholtzia roseola]|uniref:helix-turn-helix transcriptional regulator n=1 Tax=Hugenholtzia roseola TaxID=1002 RepID=UPI00040EC7BA|nr:WYL domain-containing protein [Hugenholtzia roseola]